MDSQELKQLTERWISLWTTPVDWALFDRIHAASFEDCSSAGRSAGKTGFAQGLREFTDAFPDLNTKVDDLIVEPESGKIAVRWTATGTNARRFHGIGPTNRVTEIRGIEIIHVVNGKIVKRWGEWDISEHADT